MTAAIAAPRPTTAKAAKRPRRSNAVREDAHVGPLLPVQELLLEITCALHASVAIRRLPAQKTGSGS